MRNILCLYLNTGGGHKAPATVFKHIMSNTYPNDNVILEDGFSSKNRIEKFLVEKLYQVSCNFISGSWTLFYEITNIRIVQQFLNTIFRPHTAWYMRRLIRRHKVTDVVCFHFMLTPSIVSAVRQLNANIPITVVVTDPFSCSTAWFYEKNVRFIVASEEIKKIAIANSEIDSSKINVFPFLIEPSFFTVPDKQSILDLKNKLKIPKGKKVLLVTGGGGGLPNVVLIIRQLMKLNPDFTIIVVCGRDKPSKKLLDVIAQLHPSVDLRIMGFVTNMIDFVRVCDLAIIKPGASTIFEVLGSQKPVIISTYLHGQELGNVQFAVRNKVGWFIRKPKEIAEKANAVLHDEVKLMKIQENLKMLPIEKEITQIASYIHNNS